MLTKVSILQLYLRIWSEDAVSIWFRRTCWFLVAVHLVTILAFVFSEIFICSPVPYSWHFWDGLHQGSCANRAAQLYALGAINICYDVIVFILPLHNFLKLNISWRRKTGVLTIFMVGMLVTICSIVSATFLSSSLSMMQTKQILTPFLPLLLSPPQKIRLQYLVKIGHSSNPTWEYSNAVIWSSVECNFSVICTCMPAMAGLLQRIWAKLSGKPMRSLAAASTTTANTKASSTSTNNSRAPINAKSIDPERPTTHEEMLQMRRATTANSYTTTTTAPPVPSVPPAIPTLDSSDPDAATSFKEKSGVDSEPNSSRSSDGIELRHDPPSTMTATRLEYRDGNGRLHEVKVVDTPMD